MASAFVLWTGLNELNAALRALPDELTGEAGKQIQGAANSAYVTISAEYGRHRLTGTLQNRLRIEPLIIGLHQVGQILKSNSPLAWLFDNGSQARHYITATGFHETGRMWGRTPPTHIFRRTVGRTRRALAQQLIDMVARRTGATVTDDGG